MVGTPGTDAYSVVQQALEEAQQVTHDLEALVEVALALLWHRSQTTKDDVLYIRFERDKGMSFTASCFREVEEAAEVIAYLEEADMSGA